MTTVSTREHGGAIPRRSVLRRIAGSGCAALGLLVAGCGTAAPAAVQTATSTRAVSTTSSPGTAVASTSSTSAAAPVASKPATVTWFVRSSPVENPWERKIAIPEFEKQYPNVKINLIVNPGTAWNTKILAMYAGNTPPDVHNGIVGTFIQLYAENKVRELTPFIARDKFDLAPFGPLAKNPDMCRSGKQWELPILTTQGCPVFYNMDLFDQAGLPYPPTDWSDKSWTIDKMLQNAQKLTRNWGQPNATYGLIGRGGFCSWAYLWGGDPWEKAFYEHGIAQKSHYASSQVVTAMQFSQDLIWKNHVSPRPEDVTGMNQLGDPFKTGRVAMEWTGGWDYWNLPGIKAFKWGVAAGPWKITNKGVDYTDGVMISGLTKVPDEAWLLVKYLVGKEGQLSYIRATHTPPTRTDNLDAWVDFMLPQTGMKSRTALKQVALGFRQNYMEEWAHYTIGAGQYQTIETQELSVLNGNKATAASLMPQVQQRMDATLETVYNQYKSTRLATDSLCVSLNFSK
ncbi:MAG: extracellular solute-binding protein [Chloroflexi bacterium]|nr:extracellular solute-binding protein [Chloroflexota bacterium]